MLQEVRHSQRYESNECFFCRLVMPERVGDYYNLVPLDSNQANIPHQSNTFRYQTISYKATHIRTNAICFLKRMMGIHFRDQISSISLNILFHPGCKLSTVRLYDIVEAWKKIVHANIVQLREVFLTKDFDDEQPCMTFRLFVHSLIY